MKRLRWSVLLAGLAVLVACGPTYGGYPYPTPRGPMGDVMVVGGGAGHKAKGHKLKGKKARGLKVPPGHYPPPGHCRVWHPGRPPGHQPRPVRCGYLVGRVPYGAFVLYNDRAWDTGYDWREEERYRRGSVPVVILDIVSALMD